MIEGKDFVLFNTSPVVGILESNQVQKLMVKNNLLNFVDFIRPFGERLGSLMTQDALGNTVQVNPCFLRFTSVDSLDPIAQEALVQTIVSKVMPDYGLDHCLPPLKTKEDVKNYREKAVFEHLTPWFHQYRAIVSKYMGASEHETFQHPVIWLVVLSSSDPNPVETLQASIAASRMPEIYKKGFLDPNVPKFCVVLHDPEEALHIDQSLIAQLKHICPTTVLNINSAPVAQGSNAVVPDIWAPYLAESEPLSLPVSTIRRPSQEMFHFRARANSIGQNRGSKLSQQDFASIDSFVKEFLASRVFETISKQMREWEKEVASARRGISGRLFKVGLKYFGSNKPSLPQVTSLVDPATQNAIFPFTSQEMIMRRLGDYAFMIRDFKYAQAIYESVKKDFATSEKFYRFFAGVQEMLAYISVIQSPSSGFESSHSLAVQAYTDSKMPLYADRVTLSIVELIKDYGAYRDAAFTLIKMSKDDSDLRCALFLEQAAISFIRSVPPLPRRYAFHLFLAAHRFAKCGLRDHSERNYNTALQIYAALGWDLITDHIHFSLGKQAMQKAQFEQAIDFFMKLLHKSRQTATIHRGFLAEFLYLYQQYSGMVDPTILQEKMSKLPLPSFNPKSVRISTQETHLRRASATDQSQVWQEMEQDLIEFVTSPNYEGDQSVYSKVGVKPKSVNHECAVDEPIHFSFEWSNPLQVPIPVNNIYLDCLFNDVAVVFPSWGDGEPPGWIETDLIKMEVLTDMALDANEKRTVTIKIIPKAQGHIRISGLRYLLCGIISTSRILEVNEKICLTIDVTPSMPVLDVVLHNFPEEMLSGQVTLTTLELHNRGGKGLKGLVVKTSHPNFCLFGDPANLEEKSYEQTSPLDQKVKMENILSNYSRVPINLPSNGLLDSNTTTLVPVWIRADQSGKHTLRFLFIYHSTGTREGETYRTFKLTKTLDVHASIRLTASTRPSMISLSEYVLALEVTNIRTGSELILRQLTSISKNWRVIPIDSESVTSHLKTNQTRYLYLKIERLESDLQSLRETPEFLTTFALEKLVLAEDPVPWRPPPIDLHLCSIAQDGHLSDCVGGPFTKFSQISRTRTRLNSLHQQYPTFTIRQLKELFTLFWSDDLDLTCFYECPVTGITGHITVTGLNLSLEPPLPIVGWFSGLDSKALAGRALFERTFRERKELISSLLKNRAGDASPVRIMMLSDPTVSLRHQRLISLTSNVLVPIRLLIENTSWMHEAVFDFEAVSKRIPDASSNEAGIFYWVGTTRYRGKLDPLETREFLLTVSFTQPGVHDVNRWRLETTLFFAKSLLDSSESELHRTAGHYVQTPQTTHFIQVNES